MGSAWTDALEGLLGSDKLELGWMVADATGADVSRFQTGSVAQNCNASYYEWAGDWCYQYVITVVPLS